MIAMSGSELSFNSPRSFSARCWEFKDTAGTEAITQCPSIFFRALHESGLNDFFVCRIKKCSSRPKLVHIIVSILSILPMIHGIDCDTSSGYGNTGKAERVYRRLALGQTTPGVPLRPFQAAGAAAGLGAHHPSPHLTPRERIQEARTLRKPVQPPQGRAMIARPMLSRKTELRCC